MVYVWTRQMYLHDRVAAVSNRVAEVVNGQPLEVLEHGRRFLEVNTPKNEIGWIEERAVIDCKTYDGFAQLPTQHKNDPIVSTGSLRDDIYLHISPGRKTDRFYLLPGNAKVQLLARASVAKTAAPDTPRRTPPPSPVKSLPKVPLRCNRRMPRRMPPTSPTPPPIPRLEDWWLIRDAQGHTGWLPRQPRRCRCSRRHRPIRRRPAHRRRLRHRQGHRRRQHARSPRAGIRYRPQPAQIRPALRFRPGSRLHLEPQASPLRDCLPHSSHPGLPAGTFRLQPGPGGTDPTFSFQLSGSQNVAIDPSTGIARPANPRTISYAMRDTAVRRIGPDMAPIPVMHEPGDKEKAKAAKGKRRR